jgi:hypothetical protein
MGGERLASFKNSLSINFFSLKMFSFCRIGYMLLNTLNGHVFSYPGEKPYTCNICGAAFGSQTASIRHR